VDKFLSALGWIKNLSTLLLGWISFIHPVTTRYVSYQFGFAQFFGFVVVYFVYFVIVYFVYFV